MRTIIFYWIIILTILLIGVIGKFFKKESFKIYEQSYFHRLYIIGYIMIFVLLFASNRNQYSYYSDLAQDNRLKYNIPCIDSTMYLQLREKDREIWRNKRGYNQDSIKHSKKVIIINRGGILKEQDHYINLKENKELVLETTLPDYFFRKKKTNHKLIVDTNSFNVYRGEIEFVLSDKQADSVMSVWNLVIDYDCEKYY